MVSLQFLQPFSIDIAGKTYGHPINPCKHLHVPRYWFHSPKLNNQPNHF